MLTIQTKTTLKVGDKTYEVSYPNVGQIIEIENLKLILSGNTYGDLARSQHNTANTLLNLIDGVAYFTVLLDGFKKDFNTAEFTSIEVIQQKQIIKGFKEFWNWFSRIEAEINRLDDEDTEEESN